MRARKRQRLNMNLENVQFTIQEDRQLGLCKLTYNRYSEEHQQEGLATQFKILSCWLNEKDGNCVKAYLMTSKTNPMHRNLIRDIKYLGILPARNGYCLTTDGLLIRYGMKPGSTATTTSSDDEHKQLTYFDSKAKAIKEILDGIQRYQTIGGLNLISLNRLPDTLLVETGFSKIDDLMRSYNKLTGKQVPKGVPMWLGNADQAVGSNNWNERESADKSRKQFLNLLNRMLQ